MQATYKLVKLGQDKGKQVQLDTAKGINLPYVAGTEQDVQMLAHLKEIALGTRASWKLNY